MNEALLIRNLWLEYMFLGLPATILIIKIILGYIFSSKRVAKQICIKLELEKDLRKKYNCSNFYNFHDYDVFTAYDMDKSFLKKLSPKEVNEKYPELESDYQNLKKLENSNKKLEKISNFLDRLSVIKINSKWWFIYCFISYVLLLVCIICMVFVEPVEFNIEKEFYDNGKYTSITQFENYESLPGWDKNAKHYILKAEGLNNAYFNVDGSLKTGELYYIIPDENGKYPILDDDGKPTGKYLQPINTNRMYKSFLKICQNEEDIIR